MLKVQYILGWQVPYSLLFLFINIAVRVEERTWKNKLGIFAS